jgi:hypothetical protein
MWGGDAPITIDSCRQILAVDHGDRRSGGIEIVEQPRVDGVPAGFSVPFCRLVETPD